VAGASQGAARRRGGDGARRARAPGDQRGGRGPRPQPAPRSGTSGAHRTRDRDAEADTCATRRTSSCRVCRRLSVPGSYSGSAARGGSSAAPLRPARIPWSPGGRRATYWPLCRCPPSTERATCSTAPHAAVLHLWRPPAAPPVVSWPRSAARLSRHRRCVAAKIAAPTPGAPSTRVERNASPRGSPRTARHAGAPPSLSRALEPATRRRGTHLVAGRVGPARGSDRRSDQGSSGRPGGRGGHDGRREGRAEVHAAAELVCARAYSGQPCRTPSTGRGSVRSQHGHALHGRCHPRSAAWAHGSREPQRAARIGHARACPTYNRSDPRERERRRRSSLDLAA